jgi:hypothetical protein
MMGKRRQIMPFSAMLDHMPIIQYTLTSGHVLLNIES